MDGVIHLLKLLNLSNYCVAFKENEVDGLTLMNCYTVDDVKELGIPVTAKARVLFNEITESRALQVPDVINCDEKTVISGLTTSTIFDESAIGDGVYSDCDDIRRWR